MGENERDQRLAELGLMATASLHDLAGPLTAAMAYLERATSASARLPPGDPAAAEVARALRGLGDAVGRLRELVDELHGFGRDENHAGPADVHEALDWAVRMSGVQVTAVRVERDHRSVPPVRGNTQRLGHLFLNLITNATQAINGSRGCIRLRSRCDGDQVVVEVHDDGPGIDAEVRNTLFAPFVTTKEPGAGSGLGLHLCKRTVDELGGRIEVDSQPGDTTFRVVLPAVRY